MLVHDTLIADCLYKRDANCVMLTSPEHVPVVFAKRWAG